MADNGLLKCITTNWADILTEMSDNIPMIIFWILVSLAGLLCFINLYIRQAKHQVLQALHRIEPPTISRDLQTHVSVNRQPFPVVNKNLISFLNLVQLMGFRNDEIFFFIP